MAEYEIERVCPVCGKHFDVLYKDLWAYKKARAKGGYDFYCTWKCLRAAETNKTKKPEPVPEKRENKDRLAVLKDLMAAVKDGRDAYDYLQGMGYADPKDTLRRLRITAKKDAPEIYQWMEQNGLLDMRKEHSGKGVEKVSKHKLTREQKEKAVEIAIQGGDPLVHLKKCGAKNPTAAWWYIKKTLATKNPQLLEKIPEKIGTVLNERGQVAARVEVAEKLPPEAVAEVPEHVTVVQHDDIEAAASYPAVQEKVINIKAQDKFAGFRVKTIVGEFGEYTVQGNAKFFRFESMDQKTVIFMRSEDFIPFLDELQRAAQIMEVV